MMFETINRTRFLDKILNIDARMMSEVVLDLRRYASQYKDKKVLRSNDSNEVSSSTTRNSLIFKSNKLCLITTIAIIDVSSDIKSQLANYLMHNRVRVICSIRFASLHTFKT